MTRQRIHSATARAAHRLDRASTTIPEILDHLDEQRAAVAALASPVDGGRSSDHSDPTVRAALALEHVEWRRGRLTDAVDAVHRAIDVLDEVCRDALGLRVSTTVDEDVAGGKPRCVGDGTPLGATCWAIPTPRRNRAGQTIDDGRCHTCGPRWDAARSEAELARRLRRREATT